jgi:hypothetical protein
MEDALRFTSGANTILKQQVLNESHYNILQRTIPHSGSGVSLALCAKGHEVSARSVGELFPAAAGTSL